MRFKFRAWTGSKMIFRELDDKNWYDGPDNNAKRICSVTTSDFNKYKIMGFTSLLDCEGKEIYEGDIVEVLEDYYLKEGIIHFSQGAFTILEKDKSGVFGLEKLKICENKLKEVRVLGNVYESPELLKVIT